MTIETKFNVGDTVYYMEMDKCKQSTVKRITTSCSGLVVDKYYYIHKQVRHDSFSEKELYKTKEELIASL